MSRAYEIPTRKIQYVEYGTKKVSARIIRFADTAAMLVREELEHTDRENLVIIALDLKNNVLDVKTVQTGTLCQVVVEPSQIFKILINLNAASFIMGHNHTTGNIKPSKRDIQIGTHIRDCGKLMNIPMLDNLIVSTGSEEFFSQFGVKNCPLTDDDMVETPEQAS